MVIARPVIKVLHIVLKSCKKSIIVKMRLAEELGIEDISLQHYTS